MVNCRHGEMRMVTQIDCDIQTMIDWIECVKKPSEHQQQQSGLLTQGRLAPWIHAADAKLQQPP